MYVPPVMVEDMMALMKDEQKELIDMKRKILHR